MKWGLMCVQECYSRGTLDRITIKVQFNYMMVKFGINDWTYFADLFALIFVRNFFYRTFIPLCLILYIL